MQYLYDDGDMYQFMDNETYDMLSLPEENIEYEIQFLLDGMVIDINFHNSKPIGLELPQTVELDIIDTPVSNKGDRQGACRKPAKLETGAVVTVPCHIVEGDKIKVDTRSGEYLEKVKGKFPPKALELQNLKEPFLLKILLRKKELLFLKLMPKIP